MLSLKGREWSRNIHLAFVACYHTAVIMPRVEHGLRPEAVT